MKKSILLFLFILFQFSVSAQVKTFVVDSIMDAYMRSGYADKHFMGKGKYDKKNLRVGKWKDYEVNFDNVFFLLDDLPAIKVGFYLIYGKGEFVADNREGDWDLYVLEDKTFKKIHFQTAKYVKGKRNGPATYYFPNGKIAGETTYKNDDLNGDFIQYYNDGQVHVKSTFLNAKLNGKQLLYNQAGKLKIEKNFKMDSLHGDYISYYGNGEIQWSSEYEMGAEHGSYKYYYENGQLWTEKIYSDNLLVSVRTYSESGEELDHGTLENGNGTVKHYQKDGKVYLIQTFENGLKVSEERFEDFDWSK